MTAFFALLRARLLIQRKGFVNRFGLFLILCFLTLVYNFADAIIAAIRALDSRDPYHVLTLATLGLISFRVRNHLFTARDTMLNIQQPIAPRIWVLTRLAEVFFPLLPLLLGIFALQSGATATQADLVRAWISTQTPNLAPLVLTSLAVSLGTAFLLQRLGIAGTALLISALVGAKASLHQFAGLPEFTALASPQGAGIEFSRTHIFAESLTSAVLLGISFKAISSQYFSLIQANSSADESRKAGALIFNLWLPFSAPVNALIRRDLVLFLRGGYPRSRVILPVLISLPWLFFSLLTDPSIAHWNLELMSLFIAVFIIALSAFMTSSDFVQQRARQRVFEASQPVRGLSIIRSRTILNFALTSPAILTLSYALSQNTGVETGYLVDSTLKLLGLSFCLAEYGASLGLRSQADQSGAEGFGFPMIIGATGLFLAILLRVHLVFLAVYLLFRSNSINSACTLFERREVQGGSQL